MSERVRSLERAYRASGEAADLLAWLRARQRAGVLGDEVAPWLEALASGEVSPEQVELAAYLGDPLARLLDEERAVSLATYLGEDLELVPIVLGESCDDVQALTRWVFSLGHWNESWVVEAQLVISEAHYAEEAAGHVEREDDEPWAVADWARDQSRLRRALDAAWACLGSLSDASLQALDALELEAWYVPQQSPAAAARRLTLNWGQGKALWSEHLYLGPVPSRVPEQLREGLLPKILQTA